MSERVVVLRSSAGSVRLAVSFDFNPFKLDARERRLITDLPDLCNAYEEKGPRDTPEDAVPTPSAAPHALADPLPARTRSEIATEVRQ